MRKALGVILLLVVGSAQAATVWTGPEVVFTKNPGADFTLEANQDFLTDNVILTRGDKGLLCNVAASDVCESGNFANPTGTEWAMGDLTDYASLSYNSLDAALGGQAGVSFPGATLVLHLLSDDIYLSVTGLSWQKGPSVDCSVNGNCGGFSYSRTSAVPVPAAVWLFGSALAGLGWMRRKTVA